MDFLAACEDLAANVATFNVADDDSLVSDSDLSKWQALFGFSLDEAAKAIRDWRADFARLTISQAAWLLVEETKITEGYNKESYEYSLWRAQMVEKRSRASKTHLVAKNGEAKYLVKLEHDCPPSTDSVELIRCLPKKPRILTGLDDDGKTTQFCLLSCNQKAEFLDALFKARPFYEPTLIRASVASKDLSSTSLYPTLGVDTTLPQFRLGNNQLENNISSKTFSSARPAQDEYPVWYFFYGTLANAGVLCRITGAGEQPNSITYKPVFSEDGSVH
ncbi:hypothetical protein TASIC1_0006009000 [Trichoderma asperellum]|uniref:Gamma-glutamylcyclotransferase AIG2-like domain-containing protein n=1 Tax=Trichoderma asperellum TaxID=101201 RepID=A0A6V8QU80_TRIAP|nr:hypothetical protein TASIC1_0006009000 [Trichoderma asperellum]